MTTTSQSPSTPPLKLEDAPWRALPILVSGVFLVVLDFFIVNVAMPSMQVGLRATSGQLEWVIAGYGLALAAFLLTAGRLGDRYGRRRMFLIGVAVFTVTSLLCTLANSPDALIAARVLQGLGASMIMPNMLSLIGVNFVGADRTKAIAVYGMVMGVAAASGQVIGGGLIQADVGGFGWRLIFAINIPVGLAILTFAPRLVPESRADDIVKLDPLGLVLMTSTVTALVLPLIDGRQAGWPVWTWELLGLSAALGVLTVAQQRRLGSRGGAPLFPPALASVAAFRVGLIVQLIFWCGQASFYLFLSLYLQQGRGLSALNSGLLFGVMAVAYVAISMDASALVERYGRSVITAGALILIAGYGGLLLALHGGTDGPIWWLMPGLVLAGVGQGLCITPLTAVVMSHARPEHAGAVSGALSTSNQVGNCLGLAAIGVVFFSSTHTSIAGAFGWSLIALTAVALLVTALSRLLPRPVNA